MPQSSANKVTVFKRLMSQARPYSGLLAGILALELLSIPLALLLPVPLKLAINGLAGSYYLPHWLQPLWCPTAASRWRMWAPIHCSRETAELLFAAALMVIVGVLQHAVGFVNWLVQTYTGERMVLDFRSQLFQHVQRLSLAFHDRRGTGDPTYRIQNDAPALSQIAIRAVIPSITAVLTLAGMLYITARLDWQLAMIAVVIAPCLFLVTRKYSDRVNNEWTEVRNRDSSAMSVINETLGALRVVKAFGQEKREYRRFLSHSGKYVRGQMHLALLQSSFYALVGLTIVCASAVGLFLGVRHVQSGLLSIGDFLLVMAYLGKLYEPLGMLSGKVVEIQSSLVSVGRAFALLDEIPEVAEKPSARALAHARGEVEFREVSFGYSPQHAVLRKVSLKVEPGAHIGILGRTGSGKTTLISLLTRLYDPARGAILLDGVDLRDYKLADLRDQFSIVLQEPVLFSTTIAENIAYTSPKATRADLIRAAKAAHAHEFIMRLPDGYDTEVGARGMSLSGGERQRISLARAFLKDAPILILDEPTSSVDMETEAGIVEATEALMRGRTTFIITHRPSMLQNCDLQVELIAGELVRVDWDVKSILAGNAALMPAPLLPQPNDV
jgi:ATP-binding cassette subfamily B protein